MKITTFSGIYRLGDGLKITIGWHHMPSGRRHGILNFPPSLIVSCLQLNQHEGSVGVFTMLSMHTIQ